MPGHQDGRRDGWLVTVAGVSFHARTDAGTSVLPLTLGRTAKLKDQHCLSDNVLTDCSNGAKILTDINVCLCH